MLICSQATILKIYHTFSVQFVEKKKEKNVSENVNKFFFRKDIFYRGKWDGILTS